MKRWYGLLVIAAVLALGACGGKDKPPLTPDNPEADPTMVADGGAPETPAAPAAPAPAPAK